MRPSWVQQLIERLEDALLWEKVGRMDVRYDPDTRCLEVAPAGIEWLGGQLDGERVYSAFNLDLDELAKAFDSPPRIRWESRAGNIVLTGSIDGETTTFSVQSAPFPGEEVHWVYDRGELRRKGEK